jgi:hypothetical protein
LLLQFQLRDVEHQFPGGATWFKHNRKKSLAVFLDEKIPQCVNCSKKATRCGLSLEKIPPVEMVYLECNSRADGAIDDNGNLLTNTDNWACWIVAKTATKACNVAKWQRKTS